MKYLAVALLLLATAPALAKYRSEFIRQPRTNAVTYTSPLPHTYTDDLPREWNWGDVNGTNFLTKNLNQHIPQYCGSCWAHGAMSALADRIKIARGGKGIDVNLAIQFILNCGKGTAGSCYGGDHYGAYEFVHQTGYVPYDTCQQYMACSSDSKEGLCGHGDFTCSDMNTCRTCSTFTENGGKCVGLQVFPNASVAEYGQIDNDVDKIKAEIYQRGPVAAGVNAEPILEYEGGIYDNKHEDKGINHVVSITGWGVSDEGKEYWIVRNSWGEYWGQSGFFLIATGDNQLGIEAECVWATPNAWTEVNYPCFEDGSNCVAKQSTLSGRYVDPSVHALSKHREALIPQA